MAGPKYANVDASNSYRPVGEKVHGTIVMTGPVYHNVEGSNKVDFSIKLFYRVCHGFGQA